MTLKKLVEDYSAQGLKAQVFTSVDEAKKWLEQCQ
jgi:hypothetical protein